jgi:hypothetical protein
MKVQAVFLTLSVATIAIAATAQTDLSGAWTFKEQTSISGTLYSNGSPKQVIVTKSGNAILLTKTTAGTKGDVTTADTLTTDGKPTTTKTVSGKKKVLSAVWLADKRTLTETTLIYDLTDPTKLSHTVTDIWSIERNELVLDRKDENHANGETWESKATYDKQ